MSTHWDEFDSEIAISDLHDRAVMKRAVQEQAILVLVEGESEEVALPILFSDLINLEDLGVKIANYNGHGNLRAALRLLKITLGHSRPIIVTHDNDPASIESVRTCVKQGLLDDSTPLFPIPSEPIVSYFSGHEGGSFEEAFPPELFLGVVFSKGILPDDINS